MPAQAFKLFNAADILPVTGVVPETHYFFAFRRQSQVNIHNGKHARFFHFFKNAGRNNLNSAERESGSAGRGSGPGSMPLASFLSVTAK